MNSPLPQPALSLPHVAARSLLLPAVGVVLAFVVHRFVMPHVDEYFAGIALDVGVNIMLAVSLTIVNGFTGQFSIGHAGFMALGAYTAGTITYYGSILLWQSPDFAGGALSRSSERMVAVSDALANMTGGLLARGDLLFLSGCLAGAVIAGIAGLIVGLPSLRLRGDYLAIVTLGFGEIVRILLEQSREQIVMEKLGETPTPQQLEQYMQVGAKIEDVGFPDLLLYAGSAKGFGDVPNYASAFWVMVFVTFTLAVAFRLKNSSHGRALLAIRENEVAASAMGVPVTRYKVIAFVISAALTGLAGGLYAHQVRLIPGTLGFQKSFDILIMVVLGGLGSVSGSVVAAILITLLPEILRDPPAAWPIALVVIAVLAIVRRGKAIKAMIVLAVIAIAWEVLRAMGVRLSEYRMILYALALILMMILRPKGLLGMSEFADYWRAWRRGRATLPAAKEATP